MTFPGRATLLLVGYLIAGILPGRATESTASSGRIVAVFDGIECEYSPGQEVLTRYFAARMAVHNREAARALATVGATRPLLPLSATDLRDHRSAYLSQIASLLGLEHATPLQEECYDALVDSYEKTTIEYGEMQRLVERLQIVPRLAVWDRNELVARMGRNEKIAGLTYDPITKEGGVSYGARLEFANARLQELATRRDKLRLAYRMSFEQQGGVATYRGEVATREATPPPPPTPASEVEITEWFPIIIPAEFSGEAPEVVGPRLWDGSGDRSLVKLLEFIANTKVPNFDPDPKLAYLVLHETTELGIVDRYFRGPDRRWFCDGVANYVPWRVVRDRHGEALAAQVYDLPEQLARYAGVRKQADLRRWPAAENQSAEEHGSELNRARYAFATNAVFLMNQRAGAEVLPKLFREIGRTKPEKVSIKTVEAAWKKLTGTSLDGILLAAVEPAVARLEK